MGNKINDPIARLMGLRYKSHPWHGLEVGVSLSSSNQQV